MARLALCAAPLVALLSGSAVLAAAPRTAEPAAAGTNEGRAAQTMAEGRTALGRGDFGEAAVRFGAASKLYAETGDANAEIRALTRLAQSEQALGQYRDAAQTLRRALKLAESHASTAQLAAVIGALGNVLVALGPPEEAERLLLQSAELARKVEQWGLRATVLNNLGNHYVAQGAAAKAIEAYEESAALAGQAGDASLAARASVNAARAVVTVGDAARATVIAKRAHERTIALPPSHDKAVLLISLGRTTGRIGELDPGRGPALQRRAYAILEEAHNTASEVGDARSASFALGYMGALREDAGRTEDALELTQRAIFKAQQVEAPEASYRWQLQSGRLLRALGDSSRAIAAYEEAIAILERLRHQLGTVYAASGTSFEESVGVVYFELVDLLLRKADSADDPAEVQRLLVRARSTTERLKQAELRDYFRDECVDRLEATIRNPWGISRTAAVVYPILLPDRTELLLSFGSKEIQRYSVVVARQDVVAQVHAFRRDLERRTTNQYRPHAQKLYDWLVRPYAADLADRGIDTLVFVPLGALLTVPMSALHDGQRFLVERYAVAITPSVELTDPRPIDRDGARVFLGGLSESVEGFPPLEHVPMELESVENLVGGRILLDESFRRENVRQVLRDEPFNVVHIATHGRFSGEVDETFLLTWDGKLSVEELGEFVGTFRFREVPLELITLSACDTALGDQRAALGLSGIAIRAGARSALATLWEVHDLAAARLVIEFYSLLLEKNVSRAQALQRAQQKLLAQDPYDHPGYWSAFLLISSWL